MLGCSTPRGVADPNGLYSVGTKECPVHGRTLKKTTMHMFRGGEDGPVCESVEYLKCQKCQQEFFKNAVAEEKAARAKRDAEPVTNSPKISN
jgi:hypothetical protein